MKLARTVDALAIVLRNFKDTTSSPPAALLDLKKIEQELLLADLIIAEKRLEKVELSLKKVGAGNNAQTLKAERDVLGMIVDALNEGRPLRELEFDDNQDLLIRCFQFLTQKPAVVILNSDESSAGKMKVSWKRSGSITRRWNLPVSWRWNYLSWMKNQSGLLWTISE